MAEIPQLEDAKWTPRTAAHLISRAGFGGTPRQRAELYEIGRLRGVEAAVESLVDAPVDFSELPFPEWAQNVQNGDSEGVAFRQNETVDWIVRHGMQFPLAGKMFKFFIDHFPVSYQATTQFQRYIYMYRHYDLLRQQSLGNFDDLVRGVSWSEAMIRMLNLDSNTRGTLNENFGRELLELFTLGVDGGYTESDVTNTSRAFTGRRMLASVPVDYPYFAYLDRATYQLNPNVIINIDHSEKTVLGKTFPPFPPNDPETHEHGDAVLSHILEQPACGRHLAWKLWRYFVEPNPPEDLIVELGRRFKEDYSYEIKPLLRDIFRSQAFYSESAIGQQVKDPIDLVVSSATALEVDLPPTSVLYSVLNELGMNLLFPLNIAGWPEPDGASSQWLTAPLIMLRMNLPLLWSEGDYSYLSNVDRSYETAVYEPVDVNSLVDTEILNERNLPIVFKSLAARLLPLHEPDGATQRSIHDLIYRRDRELTETNRNAALSELIRHLMSLPEFQLQ